MSDFTLGNSYYFTLRTRYINTELGGGFVFKGASFYDGFQALSGYSLKLSPNL